jgi:hypothetical protein
MHHRDGFHEPSTCRNVFTAATVWGGSDTVKARTCGLVVMNDAPTVHPVNVLCANTFDAIKVGTSGNPLSK